MRVIDEMKLLTAVWKKEMTIEEAVAKAEFEVLAKKQRNEEESRYQPNLVYQRDIRGNQYVPKSSLFGYGIQMTYQASYL